MRLIENFNTSWVVLNSRASVRGDQKTLADREFAAKSSQINLTSASTTGPLYRARNIKIKYTVRAAPYPESVMFFIYPRILETR